MPWPHHEIVSCSLEVNGKISIDLYGSVVLRWSGGVGPGICRALVFVLGGGGYKILKFYECCYTSLRTCLSSFFFFFWQGTVQRPMDGGHRTS